jgi:hypothetical protein
MTYTPESTSLTVTWESYRDPESNILSYGVSLWAISSCVDGGVQTLMVDWLTLSANYSQYTFTELDLQVHVICYKICMGSMIVYNNYYSYSIEVKSCIQFTVK